MKLKQRENGLKMRIFKNEQGYALVIVLLTITLIFPLGALLIFANTTSSRQLRMTENYHQSIAMAEMGVIFANAKIEHLIESKLPTALTRYESRVDSRIQIYRFLATEIERNFPIIRTHDNQAYRIKEMEATATIDGIELIFSSLGKAEKEYLITKEKIIASNLAYLSVADDGNEGGVPDPSDIPPPRDHFESFQTVSSRIRNAANAAVGGSQVSGITFAEDDTITSRNFSGTTTINPNVALTVDGSIFSRGWHANDARKIDIRGTFFNDSGNVWMNRVPQINVEGHFGSNQGFTLNNVNWTVGGEIAIQNNLELTRSEVTFNTYTALNTLTANHSKLTVEDARPSTLNLTDSEMLVRGSLLIEWGGSNFTRSNVRIWGHLFSEAPVYLQAGSTLRVNGNANFIAYNPIRFRGVGSRVMVFGELTNPSYGFPRELIEPVDTVGACYVIPTRNRVCQIAEDPRADGGNGGSGSGTGGGSPGGGSIALDEVEWGRQIKGINYKGIRRSLTVYE